jgi:hypothetical protein
VSVSNSIPLPTSPLPERVVRSSRRLHRVEVADQGHITSTGSLFDLGG